jgi:hypothetical protein
MDFTILFIRFIFREKTIVTVNMYCKSQAGHLQKPELVNELLI